METPAIFTHQPLTNNPNLRNLEVLPGTQDEPIRCKLRSVVLGAEYVAVSYRWGDRKDLHRIGVNGKDFRVTCNLWTFLATMRMRKNPSSFWIDAVSINQSDVDERNAQVSMMDKIYASASQVLVWLGPDHHEAADVFKILNTKYSHPSTSR